MDNQQFSAMLGLIPNETSLLSPTTFQNIVTKEYKRTYEIKLRNKQRIKQAEEERRRMAQGGAPAGSKRNV